MTVDVASAMTEELAGVSSSVGGSVRGIQGVLAAAVNDSEPAADTPNSITALSTAAWSESDGRKDGSTPPAFAPAPAAENPMSSDVKDGYDVSVSEEAKPASPNVVDLSTTEGSLPDTASPHEPQPTFTLPNDSNTTAIYSTNETSILSTGQVQQN